MRLGAYVAQLDAGLAGGRGLRHAPSCRERHRHRYEFNPKLPRAVRRRPASGARARRPTAGSSSSSSSAATRSGSARRPTPSSRAAPPGPPRCSASSIGAALERAEGRAPHLFDLDDEPSAAVASCVLDLRPTRPVRLRRSLPARRRGGARPRVPDHARRAGPLRRRPTARGLRARRSSTTPAPSPSCRSTTTAPVTLVRQYRPALDADAARAPGRASATSTASPTRDHGRAGAGRGGRPARPAALEHLVDVPQLAGVLRRGRRRLPGRPTCARSPHDRQGVEEEHMTVRAVSAGRRRWPWSTTARITDAKTIIGLLTIAPAGAAPPLRDRAGRTTSSAPAASCRSRPRTLLTWLAVEQGRPPTTLAAYRRDLRTLRRLAGRAGPRRLEPSPRRTWSTTSASSGGAGWRPPRWPARWSPVRVPAPVPRRGGPRRRRPGRRRRAAPGARGACRRRSPRTRWRRLLAVPGGRRADRPAGPGHARGALRHRRSGCPSWSACRSATSTSTRRSSGPVRQGLEGADRAARRARRPSARGLAGRRGPTAARTRAVAPAGRRRGGVPQRPRAAG